MIAGLMKNNLTQKLATGAAAIGVLAGVGLASAPAQAGIFSLQTFNGVTPVTNCTATNPGCVTDTESGADPTEPIWSTFPNFPTSTAAGEGNQHSKPGVNGYDNPMITYTGNLNGYFLIEYFGSGTATQTNSFMWDLNGDGDYIDPGENLFGDRTGATDGCSDLGSFAQPCVGSLGVPPFTNPVRVAAVNGKLPFKFTAGTTPPTNIPNGTPYNGQNPHYFATLNGTWATTTGTNMVYLGLSDRPGATGDDDAADFVVKITSVKTPEPGAVLGLLAVGGLGAFMKRKKQG